MNLSDSRVDNKNKSFNNKENYMEIHRAEPVGEEKKFERDKLIKLLQREEEAGWPSLSGDEKYLKNISDFKKANKFNSIYEAVKNRQVFITKYEGRELINYLFMARYDTLVLNVSKDYTEVKESSLMVDLL